MIEFTDKGIYCRPGNFYVDPWRPVERAVITHAHSDHARWGSKNYLAHHHTIPLLRLRLGENNYQGVEWGEVVYLNGVRVSLHPAAHMIGSSQVRIEFNGEVWVISGDYKVENDGISGAFEPVRCHSFVTESTFGLPIYRWKPQDQIFASMQDWILKNREEGKTSILIAYSLGKAQRILPCIQGVTNTIFAHGATYNAHQALLNAGWKLPSLTRVNTDTPKEAYKGQVIIAPSGADGSPWIRRFTPYETGVCSGWMQVRGNVRRRNADAGFALSDHADWNGLLETIKLTGAEKVFVTHGFTAAFSRYLNEIGFAAAEVKTEYGDEDEGAAEPASTEESSGTENE